MGLCGLSWLQQQVLQWCGEDLIIAEWTNMPAFDNTQLLAIDAMLSGFAAVVHATLDSNNTLISEEKLHKLIIRGLHFTGSKKSSFCSTAVFQQYIQALERYVQNISD